ncbi:MAG TPA: DMT family transporter [candidate division Zixibacteria bacterium]|nr:DMT family transporter [candidate division Zixibacteria bacterium]
MQKNQAYLILFMAMLAVGWAAIFIRWCEGLHPLLISFYRMFWAALIILPFSLSRPKKTFRGIKLRDLFIMLAVGFVLAMHFASWITSLFYTSVASSTVIVTTQPIYVLILTVIFTSEKVNRFSIFAILLALAGAIIVGWGDMQFTRDHIIGDLLALVGAICAAIYIFIGRIVRQRVENTAYVQIVYGSSAVFLLLMVLIFADFQIAFPVRFHIYMFLLGLVPTAFGHTLYNWALKRIRAYIVGTSILGEPLGASFYAWLIFREVPPFTTYIGAILIFFGVAALFYSERKNIS